MCTRDVARRTRASWAEALSEVALLKIQIGSFVGILQNLGFESAASSSRKRLAALASHFLSVVIRVGQRHVHRGPARAETHILTCFLFETMPVFSLIRAAFGPFVPAVAGSEVSRHLSLHHDFAPGASSRPDFL